MRKLLLILCFVIPVLSYAQQASKLDSAVIVFKNVTKDTFATVHAVIKGQEILVHNLKPNEEYKETISTYCVAPDCTITYNFKIQKTNGGYATLDNDSYTAMVGNVDINTGTYMYYIAWGHNPAEQWPDIKLKKVQ